MYTPRPYQADCIAALAKARKNGVKKGLVVMASGLGKTLTAAFDIRQFLETNPNARVLCLCHQEEILLQSKSKFQKVFGEEYSYGLYTGTYKTMHTVNFLFATFQTMRNHRAEFAVSAFDYIIVDEAHHTAAGTYQPTADYFEPQFLLGLTATKDRMDGQDILGTYEQVLYEMDIYDGWNQGWLARVDYRIMLDNLNQEEFEKYVGSSATGEKATLGQLNRTIFAPQRDEDIVKSVREQLSDLENPSIFVFCSSIDHAKNMAHCFGGEAAMMHSSQSPRINEAILREFRSGRRRIIISVDMLNEGIDIPETDAVVFLRATESVTVFFQQLGRGLRVSGNKRSVRVLDYAANLERISMILEIEKAAKKRSAETTSVCNPPASKLEPIIVNIPATKFRVERIDIEQLFEQIRLGRGWTDEELMEAYEIKCKELGRAPWGFEIDDDLRMASSVTYMQRFHGLKTLAEHFGYDAHGNHYISSKKIAASIIRKAKELGRTPTLDDMKGDPRMPGSTVIYARFGTWNEALCHCGLEANVRKLSRSDVVERLRQASKNNLMLTSREIDDDKTLPCVETVRKMFGGLERAAEAAGLTYLTKAQKVKKGQYARSRKMTDEEIKQGLRKLNQQLGHRPGKADIESCDWLPGYAACRRRFGSAEQMYKESIENN